MSGMKINRRTKSHLWLILFVVSCFLFTTNAGAQIDPNTQSAKETIVTLDYYPSLVSETDAEAMLLAEIPVLDGLLNQLTPNSPDYKLASDGGSMNSDEVPGMPASGSDYGDLAFADLVTFLEE